MDCLPTGNVRVMNGVLLRPLGRQKYGSYVMARGCPLHALAQRLDRQFGSEFVEL